MNSLPSIHPKSNHDWKANLLEVETDAKKQNPAAMTCV